MKASSLIRPPAEAISSWTQWGQKNVGSFTTKAFMDFYDYTQNRTFLAETLYPLTKLNGEFYASYMVKEGGKYNVMHSVSPIAFSFH